MTYPVADEMIARFARQQHDWMERVLKGSLNPIEVASVVQVIIDRGSRYPVLAETRLLKPVGKSTVPARTKPFSAAEFYQTGPGLYTWDSFRDRLDVEAKTVLECAPARPYVASLLKKDAYDRDIRKELPKTHLSTFEDIAGFIEAQPEGKQGFLLNNGYANIFYVEGRNGEVLAVDVRWRSGNRQWSVYDWRLDEYGKWYAGYRVLCPGNASL